MRYHPRSSRNRMAAHIRGLASRSSIEPLRSFPRSILNFSKSTDWAMLRREREVTESAFRVRLLSANSAIWSCISGGISSSEIATIFWIVSGRGCPTGFTFHTLGMERTSIQTRHHNSLFPCNAPAKSMSASSIEVESAIQWALARLSGHRNGIHQYTNRQSISTMSRWIVGIISEM